MADRSPLPVPTPLPTPPTGDRSCPVIGSTTVCPPQLTTAGERLAWEEFIVGVGPLTRAAYTRAVRRFFTHLDRLGLTPRNATPRVVHEYIESLHARPGFRQRRTDRPAATRTRKQHLAAIRHCYHHLVLRHAALINPAASVRSPRLIVERGVTVAIRPDQVQRVLAAFDPGTLVAHRDRTILTVLSLTAARVGAIARLTRSCLLLAGENGADADDRLILHEKNAKERSLPLTSELRRVLIDWLMHLGPAVPEAPMFPSFRGNHPTGRPMSGQDILRMVRRRLALAGLPGTHLTCHSFRAGAATTLLTAGVELTKVQDLLGHADPRTSRMYDARSREVRTATLTHLHQLFPIA